MRRSPVPGTPLLPPAAETGGSWPRRIAARAAAALIVLAAVTGCVKVGEPEAPGPSPSAGAPNGEAAMEGAPPMSAGGAGGGPRDGGRSGEDAEEAEDGKNGDESPGPSTSASREPSGHPGPQPGDGDDTPPTDDATESASSTPSVPVSPSGSASSEPAGNPGAGTPG